MTFKFFISKLVNTSVPGTIDPRAINNTTPLTPFQIKVNFFLETKEKIILGKYNFGFVFCQISWL